MQTMARLWAGVLLGTCLLLGVSCDASSLARYEERKLPNGPWPHGAPVPPAAGDDEGGSPGSDRLEDDRTKESSFSGYVYSRNADGPAFFEGRRNEFGGEKEEESGVEKARENAEGKANDSSGNSENRRADGKEKNSDSDNETIVKNEIESRQEVPSFFKITSRVTSSTSVSESLKNAKSDGAKELLGAAKVESRAVNSESNTDESEQSSKKFRERTRTTQTKSLKRKAKESNEKQVDADLEQGSPSSGGQRSTAYDHFFAASRRGKSNSQTDVDDRGSENEDDEPEKTAVEVEGSQKSVEERKKSSFFTIATHKTPNLSARQPGRSSKKHGERKTSDLDEGRNERRDEKEDKHEVKNDGASESEDDSADDEQEEEENEEDEEVGSEEESDEDESSEEYDGSPAFIVLRRPNANSDRLHRNRESAKHFSVSQVGYRMQKDISDEKLLFLPVIDGKDLSISTIRALSSQLSRRGEPIHLEYKELKEGVEGYVAELDSAGTEYLISKLMELIADLDQSEEVETITDQSLVKDESVNGNLYSNVAEKVTTRGRISPNLEDSPTSLPDHFQLPQNRIKSQIPVSIKETVKKVPPASSRGRPSNASPILGSAQSSKSASDSQQTKSLRTSMSPYFRIQSSTRPSQSRTKIKTAPGAASSPERGSSTKEISASNTADLNDESRRSKSSLLPTTIPIEISPVRSSLKSSDDQPRIRIKAELVHSVNPNSKTKASIKISDEEIKAITNRYSEFLENYRRSRARARTPNSQILRENQARQQLSEHGSSSERGKDSTRSNIQDISNSKKTAPVEIVSTVPMLINEKQTALPESRVKATAQRMESIHAREETSNFVSEGDSTGETLSSVTVKTFLPSPTVEIQSNTDGSRTENLNALNHNEEIGTVAADGKLSLEVIETGSFTSIRDAKKETEDPLLVPLTEPNKVKANKIVLISGVESDSLERDSKAAVAIPSTPITLISKEEEVNLTLHPSGISDVSDSFIQSTAAFQNGPANNRVDHMREIIRNRLQNILNIRAQKAAAGQSNIKYSLEHVDPSQLSLKVLSKMQASRLSNEGVRLADLSSSPHLTDALRLENNNQSEIERALPTLILTSSNDFAPDVGRRTDSSTSSIGNNAFVSKPGAGFAVDKPFEEPSSPDNIVEESQRIETSSSSIVTNTPVISSGNAPVDDTNAEQGTVVQLLTASGQGFDVLQSQPASGTELTGDAGVSLLTILDTHSPNQDSAVFQIVDVVPQNPDREVSATDEAGDLLHTLEQETPRAVLEIEDGTQVSIKHDIISDEAIAHSSTLITGQTDEERQHEVVLSDTDNVDAVASDVALIEKSEQEQVGDALLPVVSSLQLDSLLPSSPSESTRTLGEVAGPSSSVIESVAQFIPLPNVFNEASSINDVSIPTNEVSILNLQDDTQSGVDLPLTTINPGLNELPESSNSEIIPTTSDLGESQLQGIPDFSLGPPIEEAESLNPAIFTSADGDAPQLQEIGIQIENLSSSPSLDTVSKSSSSATKENQMSGDNDAFAEFHSEQSAQGKSLTQAIEQKSTDQFGAENGEARKNTDLRETIQERLNSRLMHMIQARTQGATLDFASPVPQQAVAADSAPEGVALEKDVGDQAPPLSTTTDSVLLASNGNLEASHDGFQDVLSQQTVENQTMSEIKASVDSKASKISQTTIDDEIQKRFQARLMQMIQERAIAMMKMPVTPVTSVPKQVEEPLSVTESTLSIVDVDVTTVSPEPESTSDISDLLAVTPGTKSKELTIIESLGSADSTSTHEVTGNFENEQVIVKTDKAFEDQLQERFNARLMQMIQDRMKGSGMNLINVSSPESTSINIVPQEITTQTSEIETETAPIESQQSDVVNTTEVTIKTEKSFAEMSEVAIREFMLERFNAGLATVVHTKDEEAQRTISDVAATEFSTPATQELEATVQKIELEAAWSDNDQDKSVVSPQLALKHNVKINATRESDINERVNSRLMEILQQRNKENTSASIAKELGSDTAASTAQNSNLELKGKSSGSENLQTIEQLIAGVEGMGDLSVNDGGAIPTVQESAAAVPVDEAVEPLRFESIPNVRVLSPNEITQLIQNGHSGPTTDVISSAIDNEVHLSAMTPEILPESVPQSFAEGIALKPLRVIRLPDSTPTGQPPQQFSPRVNIPPIPQGTPAVTRQQSLPAPSHVRGSRVLTQEQFISHLREIENKQRFGSVQSSQSLVGRSPRPGPLSVLETFGVSGNVVKANKQSVRTQNEVFIQPVVRRPRPPPLPFPVNPPFVPAFPNARSAKLLSRLKEDDLQKSSSRTKPRTTLTPALGSGLSFIGSSAGSQFFAINRGKSGRVRPLQKSLSNSAGPPLGHNTGGGVEIRTTTTPEFIVTPKKVKPSPQLPPRTKEVTADQHPIIVKAKLQNVLTESTPAESRRPNSLPDIAKTNQFVNVSPPRTTTVKIPLMMAKSTPGEMVDVSHSRTTALQIPIMMAKSMPSQAELGRSTSRKRTRLGTKSSAAPGLRIAKQSPSRTSAQPISPSFNQHFFTSPIAQSLRFTQKQELQGDTKVTGLRRTEEMPTSRMLTLNQPLNNIQLNSVALPGNEPELVTVRSRSGNLFTIPNSLFQEFLNRRNKDTSKTNIQQARTLLQTLFVDGERERLKRRAPRVGTVTRDQLHDLMNYIRQDRTTSGDSTRKKRATDVSERTHGEDESASSSLLKLREVENTERSDEILSPKVVFDDRGAYLTNGKGKNIFFQAMDVFYH